MSDTISYSELQATLEACLDKVCENREPLFIKRKNGGNVVVMSSDDYAALEETAYLLRSPANAAMLMNALNRDPQERIIMNDMEALKNAIGL